VQKSILAAMGEHDSVALPARRDAQPDAEDVGERLELLRSEMLLAAESLDFERAAELRDQMRRLEGAPGALAPPKKRAAASKAPAAGRARARRR
jgi:excinuclease UvrABC helicase subunit UvrB